MTKKRVSERLSGELSLDDTVIAEARELIRRRKVLDFMLVPGRVSAKIQEETGRTVKVEIGFKQISERVWHDVYDRLAREALYLAMLLAGTMTAEMELIFEELGNPLYPSVQERITYTVNGQRTDLSDKLAVAVLLQLLQRLDDDPFTIFLLRGKGRDETIAELQQRRAEKAPAGAEEPARSVQRETFRSLARAAGTFWSSGKKLETLSYTIRADELPAALLKRHDPLPLGGIESEIDSKLEEAYERVARLAQSYGLGL